MWGLHCSTLDSSMILLTISESSNCKEWLTPAAFISKWISWFDDSQKFLFLALAKTSKKGRGSGTLSPVKVPWLDSTASGASGTLACVYFRPRKYLERQVLLARVKAMIKLCTQYLGNTTENKIVNRLSSHYVLDIIKYISYCLKRSNLLWYLYSWLRTRSDLDKLRQYLNLLGYPTGMQRNRACK